MVFEMLEYSYLFSAIILIVYYNLLLNLLLREGKEYLLQMYLCWSKNKMPYLRGFMQVEN